MYRLLPVRREKFREVCKYASVAVNAVSRLPFHSGRMWRILHAMSRKHIPDSELPPITPSGTGAPRRTEAKRVGKKKTVDKELCLGSRALGDWEKRRKFLAKGLVPGNPGNSGGKKGRSGRRPDIWLAWCQKLMLNKGTQRAIRRVIRDKSHPAYGTITKMIRDSAFPVTKQQDITLRTSLEDILAHSYDAEK